MPTVGGSGKMEDLNQGPFDVRKLAVTIVNKNIKVTKAIIGSEKSTRSTGWNGEIIYQPKKTYRER